MLQPDGSFTVDNISGYGIGQVGPGRIVRTHPPSRCSADEACVIHKPSNHHMLDWPTCWRADKRLMERTCPHGVGHPDPDDLAFHIRNGRDFLGIHGCDGCCGTPVLVGVQ